MLPTSRGEKPADHYAHDADCAFAYYSSLHGSPCAAFKAVAGSTFVSAERAERDPGDASMVEARGTKRKLCVVVLEGAAAEDGGEVRLTPLNVSGLKASRKLALSLEDQTRGGGVGRIWARMK